MELSAAKARQAAFICVRLTEPAMSWGSRLPFEPFSPDHRTTQFGGKPLDHLFVRGSWRGGLHRRRNQMRMCFLSSSDHNSQRLFSKFRLFIFELLPLNERIHDAFFMMLSLLPIPGSNPTHQRPLFHNKNRWRSDRRRDRDPVADIHYAVRESGCDFDRNGTTVSIRSEH